MSKTNIIYNVEDKPGWGKTIVFALQQLLAILAATIAVPAIIGNGMSASAALLGAGIGTMVYLLFTKFKSPVFLGSSFAFIGSMFAAFGGAASAAMGYIGLILGAAFAALVYVIIAIIVKFAGTAWINKIMPAVVIGPTVAIIGLSLAGNAVGDLLSGSFYHDVTSQVSGVVESLEGLNIIGTPTPLVEGGYYATYEVTESVMATNMWIALLCGLITLFVTIIVSVYGKKFLKMIPFIFGILAGYAAAAIFTGIGYLTHLDFLKVIDFTKFLHMEWLPRFTFIEAFKGFSDIHSAGEFFTYFGAVAVAYVPVAFVVFAEHIADHKNLGSIIDRDLLNEPGLHRTLLGDGVGSFAGAFFGGCPNTTYGESVGTVAISGNASIRTIIVTAIMAMILAFIAPFSTFLSTIPSCVMGGVCIALYGFIAVSGLKMIQGADLGDNRNLFVVSVILIAGIGGLELTIGGKVTITEIACALILGIIVNIVVHFGKKAKADKKSEVIDQPKPEEEVKEEAKQEA